MTLEIVIQDRHKLNCKIKSRPCSVEFTKPLNEIFKSGKDCKVHPPVLNAGGEIVMVDSTTVDRVEDGCVIAMFFRYLR